MASNISSSLLVFLCLLLLQQGGMAAGRAPARCSMASIVITQDKTGRIVEGRPEYEVTVRNTCRCPQAKLLARCYGLSSVEPLDLTAVRPVDGTNCILNDGKALPGGATVKFKYAWLTPQDFPLVSSQLLC